MLIEKALKQAEVNTELEGNPLTAEQKELVAKVIKGELQLKSLINAYLNW